VGISYVLPGFIAIASRLTARNDADSKNPVYTRSPRYYAREFGKGSKRNVALRAKGSFIRNTVSYRYQVFDLEGFPGGLR
jgi:hypothetical protein